MVSRLLVFEYWHKKGVCEYGVIDNKRTQDGVVTKPMRLCQFKSKHCDWSSIRGKQYFLMLGKTGITQTFFFCPVHWLTIALENVAIQPLDRLDMMKAGIIKS